MVSIQIEFFLFLFRENIILGEKENNQVECFEYINSLMNVNQQIFSYGRGYQRLFVFIFVFLQDCIEIYVKNWDIYGILS